MKTEASLFIVEAGFLAQRRLQVTLKKRKQIIWFYGFCSREERLKITHVRAAETWMNNTTQVILETRGIGTPKSDSTVSTTTTTTATTMLLYQ